jgi:phage terminase large subunit-like protein
LLYVDELREIDEATWAAVTPITRARPNAQVFWTSNAGDLTSNVLNEQRRRALTFTSDRMGYYEYSAPAGSAVDDVEAWKMANPALGHTLSMCKTLKMRQPLTALMLSKLSHCQCGLMQLIPLANASLE